MNLHPIGRAIALLASANTCLQLIYTALQHIWRSEERGCHSANGWSKKMTLLKKMVAAYIASASLTVPFGMGGLY